MLEKVKYTSFPKLLVLWTLSLARLINAEPGKPSTTLVPIKVARVQS
jgi:hypothetical protein